MPGDNRRRHSWTSLYLLATPATIKRQCACSALSLETARLWPVGAAAAAIVQIADINKGKYAYNYQFEMSLLVIDFNSWKGEMVNSWSRSWQLETPTLKESRHMFLTVRTTAKKYQRLTP